VATPQLAAAAADVSIPDARRLLDDAEEAGLLSRRGRTGQAGRLLHPLVRSFLEGRLQESVGQTGIAEIHVRIAVAAEPNSWWLAGHHYAAAGRHDDVARVLSGSLEAILGSGGAQAAVELITAVGLSDDGGWAKALIARSLLREGDVPRARDAARLSLEASARGDPTIPPTVALATLTTVEYNAGEYEAAVDYAGRLRDATRGTIYAAIAESILAVADAMIDGSLAAAEQVLQKTASLASRLSHAHYVGISYLNLAWLARGAGDPDAVLAAAQTSLESLASTSAGPEMDTVRTVLAWAHASRGFEDAADREIRLALASPFAQGRFETLLESSDAVGSFIDPAAGQALIDQAEAVGAKTRAERTYSQLFRAESFNRIGRSSEARTLVDSIPAGRYTGYPGFYVRLKVARAVSAFVTAAEDRRQLVADARAQAELQEAQGALRTIRLLEALDSDPETASGSLRAVWSVDPGTVAACAEPVLSRMADLDDGALQAVLEAARQRPRRWIRGLRSQVDNGPQRSRWAAGTILEEIGEKSDVRRLRALSRELKGQYRAPSMGRGLARRTADRVWIEDQGRVVIRIGDRSIAGSELRRKPLALICFLLSRPGMSATRDQVLEALWPGADPDQAVNSLHQTVYFLRRIIEPSYSDDLSPGYVNQDTELLWLDPELIASRSVRCKERMKALGAEPSAEDVLGLAREYRGRFALDFSYEDWAATYRESLHAQYLELMERTIASTTAAARFADAIELTRALLDTDPTLDSFQASLVKMYRVVGAHAAAAEQYQVYSSVMREELGLEPEPLDQL
jgi:DNA-binding SARP family transcriptional activator